MSPRSGAPHIAHYDFSPLTAMTPESIPLGRKTRPVWLASADQADWPWLAGAWGSLRQAPAPKAAYGEPTGIRLRHCLCVALSTHGRPALLLGRHGPGAARPDALLPPGRQAETRQRQNAREGPKHSACHFCLHEVSGVCVCLVLALWKMGGKNGRNEGAL